MTKTETYKYIILTLAIILIVAIIIIIYMYSTKKKTVEGMKNLDWSGISSELIDRPWANDDECQYRNINSKNNKDMNKDNTDLLKRKDQVYTEYVNNDTNNSFRKRNKKKNPNSKNRKFFNMESYYPVPFDDRPDLSQCQPCICPNDNTTSESDEDSNENKIINKKKYMNNKKN